MGRGGSAWKESNDRKGGPKGLRPGAWESELLTGSKQEAKQARKQISARHWVPQPLDQAGSWVCSLGEKEAIQEKVKQLVFRERVYLKPPVPLEGEPGIMRFLPLAFPVVSQGFQYQNAQCVNGTFHQRTKQALSRGSVVSERTRRLPGVCKCWGKGYHGTSEYRSKGHWR